MPPICQTLHLGLTDYQHAWDLQKAIAHQTADGSQPNTLLLLEHPHVYTLGRRGKQADLLLDESELAARGIQVHWIDRGGEATYHGPGQLVGYPILNLRNLRIGPLKYVRTLEQALLRTLADFGIDARLADKLTGVWVNDVKIAAIGVKIGRGVTTHGFALNVDPDISYFDGIVPCGLPNVGVTSMAHLLGRHVDLDEVDPILVRHFGKMFQMEMHWATPDNTIWKTVESHLRQPLELTSLRTP